MSVSEPRSGLLRAGLDLLKPGELTGNDMKVLSRNVADAKSEVGGIADGLRRDTLNSYVSMQHNVDRSLVEVRKRPIKLFDCKTMACNRASVMLFTVQ